MWSYLYHKIEKKSIPLIVFGLLVFPFNAVFAFIPNDPFVQQWSYRDIGVFSAWDKTTGSRDVVVAVIDDGFDSFHPELESNVWHNLKEIANNNIDDDNNGYVDDVDGWNFIDNNSDPRPSVLGVTDGSAIEDEISHGTMVAGIIGAVGNNGRFGSGINWQVRLMNLKVLGSSGVESSVVPIAKAIYYAVDNGASIINISLIGPEDADIREAVHYAYIHDVAVIAAAGNDYFSLNQYPRDPICADLGQSEQWVLGVSAINETHHLANFSNTGSCIDITAPGVNVSTTLRYAPAYGLDKFYDGPFSGTSFAAPFVSGAAALLKSIHPEWGAKEIYNTILSTVHKTPPKDEYGYAQAFGRGLLQVNKAVELAIATASTGRSFERIMSYNSQGVNKLRISLRTTNGDLLKPAVVPSISNLETLITYTEPQGTTYVALEAVRQKKKLIRQISVYNGDGQKKYSWPVPWSGVSKLAVVNDKNNVPVIVVSPGEKSRIVFQTYTMQGKTIQSFVIPEQHNGVTLGVMQSSGGQELLAVYKDRGNNILHTFNSSFEFKYQIPLQGVTSIGSIAAGDLNGNGSREYVVASGNGEPTRLTYYNDQGEILRKFIAYNDSYTGGLSLLVGDYDHDGADDVVVAPAASQSKKQAALPVRVWSGNSRLLAEWWPFDSTYNGAIGLLAQYK